MKTIDTHIHIWDFEKASYSWLENDTSLLNRTYAIGELEKERKEAGVDAGVLVQAANNFEDTDWMLEVAEKTDWIRGVVGWLPLTDPEATERALQDKYLVNPYFKGVRHLIHDEPDARWLLREEVIESLRILARHHLTYDLVGILPEHISTALRVAEKVPDLKMVFDHLNQPPIQKGERFGKWGELIRQASAHPNFHAKISGMGTTSGKSGTWDRHDIVPYVEFVLDAFGVSRCFCGGDWPVSLLAGSYSYSWTRYREAIRLLLHEKEQEKVFYENARIFYQLSPK
ncbi:amidohydrolase [Sinomicrobium pectinilyticum]|uniref:Amidohydrolase n=1 Tax=Sinomicrobium pectinilyticum TaxID=1084421 RepID=A0A3N0DYC6_SINP1|nr:amidohydrolase family protein [Sinomicrobium pectinilyticum]RNL80615.1 amidohydrolase [Sinomicrobium pectinilyticum]